MDTEALRAEARAAFELLAARRADQPTAVLGAGADDLEPGRAYLEALAPGGWAVPTWPRSFGGRDATPEEAGVIGEELARFAVPDLYPYLVGLHVVGPTLLSRRPARAARPLAARRSPPAPRSGASSSRSPAPAPTSPTSAPAPTGTVTSGG